MTPSHMYVCVHTRMYRYKYTCNHYMPLKCLLHIHTYNVHTYIHSYKHFYTCTYTHAYTFAHLIFGMRNEVRQTGSGIHTRTNIPRV
jgi:hypothetical protein